MPRRLSRDFIKRARLHGTPRVRAACRFDLAAVLEELGSSDDEVRACALGICAHVTRPGRSTSDTETSSERSSNPSWLVRQTALQIEREVVEIEAVRAAWERAETYVTRERLKMRARTTEGQRRG